MDIKYLKIIIMVLINIQSMNLLIIFLYQLLNQKKIIK